MTTLTLSFKTKKDAIRVFEYAKKSNIEMAVVDTGLTDPIAKETSKNGLLLSLNQIEKGKINNYKSVNDFFKKFAE